MWALVVYSTVRSRAIDLSLSWFVKGTRKLLAFAVPVLDTFALLAVSFSGLDWGSYVISFYKWLCSHLRLGASKLMRYA